MWGQKWALETSQIEEPWEGQRVAHEKGHEVGGPGCLWNALLLPAQQGSAQPHPAHSDTGHSGQVTSVKRKEMAAKANDHPYL